MSPPVYMHDFFFSPLFCFDRLAGTPSKDPRGPKQLLACLLLPCSSRVALCASLVAVASRHSARPNEHGPIFGHRTKRTTFCVFHRRLWYQPVCFYTRRRYVGVPSFQSLALARFASLPETSQRLAARPNRLFRLAWSSLRSSSAR